MNKIPFLNFGKKNLFNLFGTFCLTASVLDAQTPVTSVTAPTHSFLGESFSMEVSFDNSDLTLIGYDPVVELILPALPDDGEGGVYPDSSTSSITVESATYLGSSIRLDFVGYFDSETLVLENPLTGELIAGLAGEAMYLLHYPLSSIAPDQPAPVIDLEMKVDALTPLEAQDLSVRGIFNYGNDPSGQSSPLVGSATAVSVTPSLLTVEKTVSYAEGETATGPSFPGTWRLVGDIALGADLEGLIFTDSLPDNFHVTSAAIIRPAGGQLLLTGSNPGYALNASWDSASGSSVNTSSEIVIEVVGYVPQLDIDTDLVLAAGVGEGQITNVFAASYDFERVGIEPEGGLSFALSSNQVVVDALTLAIQKSASIVSDVLPVGNSPLDVVEFSLDLQVSDFKSLDNVRIVDGITTAAGLTSEADILGDGMTFQNSFVPEYEVSIGGVTVSGSFDSGNYSVTLNPSGHITGSSEITFDLSQQLIDDAQFDINGILSGAQLLNPVSLVGTTAEIRYRVSIDESFDSPVSGDHSVDVADVVTNDVDVIADDLTDSIIVGDESSVTLVKLPLSLTHTIERIVTVEGETLNQPAGTPLISPGDTVTFAISISVPTGDIEDLVLEDYVPFSLFDMNDVNGDGVSGDFPTFNPVVESFPTVGTVTYGPADEYNGNYTAYGDPDFSYSVENNSLSVDFGSVDTPDNLDADGDAVYVFEIRYTIVAGSDDLPDQFEMTSLAVATHGSTNAGVGDERAYTALLFSKSEPVLTKGVIACTNGDAIISPSATTEFDSAGSDGDCVGAHAGDTVRFAITVQNTGSDPLSHLLIQDVLPVGFDAAQAKIVSVNRADGTAMVMNPAIDSVAGSADETAFFGSGIELDSTVSGNFLTGGSTTAGTPYGSESLVVLIDVVIEDTISPSVSLDNLASASVWYAAAVPLSGPYTEVSDNSTVTMDSLELDKTLVSGLFGDEASTGTVDNNGTTLVTGTIGEVMTYDITLRLPQGQVLDAVLTDTLPYGMEATSVNGVTARVLSMDSSISSTNLESGATDVTDSDIIIDNGLITLDFGTLTRAVDVDTALKEIVVRVYSYVDAVAHVGGSTITNSATLNWSTGSEDATDTFTLVRPNLNLAKTMTPVVSGGVQAGSTVRVDLTITNPGEAWETSAAHDFMIEDLVLSEFFDTSTIQEDVTPDGFVFSTQVEGDDIRVVYTSVDLPRNGSETFSFTVDIQDQISLPVDLSNVAVASGTSLPSDPPSGVESDESDEDTAITRSNVPTISKSFLSSSEAHTSESPLRATIGERLVYRLRIDVPEGQFSDLSVRDKVPSGLDFVGENTDALMAFPGLGYAISGPMAGTMQTAFTGITDNDPTPESSLTEDGSGDDVYFDFGAFSNFPDDDDSNDYFYVDLELVVIDSSSVVGYGDSATKLSNRGTVFVTGMESGEGDSNRVNVTIEEPNLTIQKTILESSGDGGDSFTVQVTLTNDGDSNAYDVMVEDPIAGLHFDTTQIGLGLSNPSGWTLSLESVPSDSDTDTTVLFGADAGTFIAPGDSIVFQFTIVADDDVEAPAVITNTAEVSQVTTLDGSLVSPGGITERDSSGATDSADINISGASLQLSYITSSESYTSDGGAVPVLTFGERAVMRIDVELPDGSITNPTLYLELPVGLDFVGINGASELTYSGLGYSSFLGSSSSLVAAAFSGVMDADVTANDSQTVDGSGADVGFQFNTILNAADGDDLNDAFYFFVEVVCVDESELIGFGEDPDQLSTSVRMDGGNGINGASSGLVVIQLAEPSLSIDKTMSSLSASNPDQTTITIVVTNDGDSAAHDLSIEDVLDAANFDISSASLVSLPEDYSFSSAAGTVTFTSDTASIVPGGSASFVFDAEILPTALSPIDNSATVETSSSLDHSLSQPNGIGERLGPPVSSEYVLGIPNIEAFKKATDLNYTGAPLESGDRIGYTITVQNTGGDTASSVTLLDSIPTNTSYVVDSLIVAGVSVTPSLPDMSFDLSSIAASQTVEVYFEVEVDSILPADARKITNTASATFAERSTLEVADNDPEGHDPVTDDGIDDPTDSGNGTADDDPTVLYLMQGASTMRSYLAFEDLKNRGWSDWDHNDILLDITTYYLTDAQGDVESVIVLYQMLARGASYEAEVYLTVPLTGAATWTSSYLENDHTFISKTTGDGYDSINADVYESTRTALPPNVDTNYDWGPSRTERFDATEAGGRAVVQIMIESPELNPFDGFSLSPHDTWAHMVDPGVDIHRVQYKVGNTQFVWQGPLAGRSLPLVVEFSDGFDWPAEFQPIWETHPEYADFIKSGESSYLDWWRSFTPDQIWVNQLGENPGVGTSILAEASGALNALSLGGNSSFSLVEASGSSSDWPQALGGLIVASPTIRDLDGDGDREILIGARDGNAYIFDHLGALLSGWPQLTKADGSGRFGLVSSPSVGDIDNDGIAEIVTGTVAGHIYAWELDGSVVSGFPVYLGRSVKSVCAVVDIDGVAGAEIIAHVGNSELHVLNGSGVSIGGSWPVDLGGDEDQFDSWILASSPVVFDLGMDGSLQIAVGSTADQVHIFNADGTVVPGWPVSTGDWVYPTVTPVDLDGDFEPEIVVGSGDGKVYAWSADGSLVSGFPVTLDGPIIGSIATADMTGDGTNELVAVTYAGTAYLMDNSGVGLSGWPKSTTSHFVASPIILDVDADGSLDIVVGSRDNWLYAWSSDGVAIPEATAHTGDWIDSTAAAADIDNDGLVELVYASYDQNVYVIELSTTASDSNLPWPSFRGDASTSVDTVVTDRDADGLPDAMEMAYFDGLGQTGSSDFDGDGFDNESEWIAGTDASDFGNFFAIDSAYVSDAFDETSQFTLTWQGRADRTYQFFSCQDLTNEDWSLVDGVNTFYTDEDQVMMHELDIDHTRSFFRVEVERGDQR